MTTKAFPSIRSIHDAFDRREVSATELATDYLARARGSRLNAFITILEDRALEQARAADAVVAREGRVPRDRFPLLGVPVAVKDSLATRGARTTCASRTLESYVPPYSATCVERLERAGATLVGKTNLDEFAMGGSNESSAFGPVLHPTHPGRVAGGSSGGSAAAVAADLCVAALGSDTGGSIRLPASFCGIAGVKPTYGRVSRFGLVAFGSSLDQVGPMAGSIEDAARVLEAISGADPADSTCAAAGPVSLGALADPDGADVAGLRVGVPEEHFAEGVAPAVLAATRAALAALEARGARLVPIRLPHSRYAVAVYYLIAVSEASSNLSRFDGVRFGARPPSAAEAGDLATFYKRVRARFGDEVKRRILLGTFALSAGYADAYFKRACQVRRLIQRDFLEAFERVDVIAGPVAPTTAFGLGEKVSDPLTMYLNDVFTVPANLAGLPAVSVPCGRDGDGLPIGLQLQAPAFEEGRMLRAALAVELALGARGGAP